MNQLELAEPLLMLLTTHGIKLLLSLAVLAVYWSVNRISRPRIQESVDQGNFKRGSAYKARYITGLLTGVIALCALMFIWGIGFHAIMLLSTTVLTLTGVALFANWSLLSNITAFFVLLLHPSYRRGNFVRVMEMDNYIEGYISEINLFNTTLVSESRETIVYPNNLLIARPTVINPRERYNVIGKSVEFAQKSEDSGSAPAGPKAP